MTTTETKAQFAFSTKARVKIRPLEPHFCYAPLQRKAAEKVIGNVAVQSCTDIWIEMTDAFVVTRAIPVAPYAGAWIEIWKWYPNAEVLKWRATVAPHVGAWLAKEPWLHPVRMHKSKSGKGSRHVPPPYVTSYADVWIEIPRIQPPVRCIPYGRMNRQCKCVNQKDEHDSPYDMNRNKLVESRNKRGNESKRNVGVYWTKYDLHK